MSDIKIIISGINDAYFIIPHILAKSTHHPSNKKPRYWAVTILLRFLNLFYIVGNNITYIHFKNRKYNGRIV